MRLGEGDDRPAGRLDRVQAESVAASSRTRVQALDGERARILGRLVTLVALPAAEVDRLLATPAPAAAPKLPPPGPAKTLSLPDFIEKNFISGREGHKENMVGCSGVGQAVLWQVREPWDGRQHDSADGMLYVVGGEGAIKLEGREMTVTAGSFAVVPRGTTYGFTRRGRNPLIVLAILAGAPCAAN